jgi:hypothetical protein
VITNPTFVTAGTNPGDAASWTLRSACARQAIAPFGSPPTSVEGFETWTLWIGALLSPAFAPFAPNGTEEDFDAWPSSLFALELTGGLVAATESESFDDASWTGAAFFVWANVPQVQGAFAGGTLETFTAWQPGVAYIFAFTDAMLSRAMFQGGASSETFATWTTINTTL